MNNNSKYIQQSHKIGRIGALVFIILSIAIPFTVGITYNVLPSLKLVLHVGSDLMMMYVPLAVTEVVSYASILGSSSYISFITGNVIGIKLPVAISALKISGQQQSTEGGDAVATMAVAMSSMITMLIILIGLILMVPLKPILQNPLVVESANYMLPAMLGALAIPIFSRNSGKYIIKNKMLSLAPCVIIMTGLVILGVWESKYQGQFIVMMIPVTVITALFLYRKNIIRIYEKQ